MLWLMGCKPSACYLVTLKSEMETLGQLQLPVWSGREEGQIPVTCWGCRTGGSNALNPVKLGMGEGLPECSLTNDEAQRSQASGGRDEVVPKNQLLGCQLPSL